MLGHERHRRERESRHAGRGKSRLPLSVGLSSGVPNLRACIVVPCFNEATRLDTRAFADFVSAHADVRFLFVDDGSRDATREVLTTLSATRPAQLDVLILPENRGKAEAVRAGVLHAFAQPSELVGYWDADLATPLDEIPRFIDILAQRESTWIVMGSRVSLLGRDIQRKPSRHYLGRIFATASAVSLGVAVYDTQCGAKLLRNNAPLRAAFAEPFSSRWIFDVELLARVIAQTGPDEARKRIYEMPLLHWSDVAGSKVKPLDFVRAFLELTAIVRRYRR